jgi:uncharacterized protein (DUF1330 family)
LCVAVARLAVTGPVVGPLNSRSKIIAFEGEPPKRVAITEWDSLEQAEAFVNSAAYKSLAPERAKAAKIREYAVEATH